MDQQIQKMIEQGYKFSKECPKEITNEMLYSINPIELQNENLSYSREELWSVYYFTMFEIKNKFGFYINKDDNTEGLNVFVEINEENNNNPSNDK